MRLDQHAAVIEADGRAVGAGAQTHADPPSGQGVQRARHDGVVIAADLGVAPGREVVRLDWGWLEGGVLLGLEMLEGPALGARVPAVAVLLETPAACAGPGGVEVDQLFTGETIVAHRRHRPLDPALVLWMADAGGIDVEAARLRILEKRIDQFGLEIVGGVNDRLRVVRDQHAEDAAVKLPRGLTGFDRRGRRFPEDGIDKAVSRADRREDPRAEATTRCPPQPANPPRVELQLLSRLAIHDAHRRRAAAEAQLAHRIPVEGRIGQFHALPAQQRADFGQPQLLLEPFLDVRPVLHACRPAVAVRSLNHRMQCEQHRRHLSIGDRRRAREHPCVPRDLQVATDRLRIEPQYRGDALGRRAGKPQAQHLLHFDHRDLAIRHPLLQPAPGAGSEGG